MTSATDQRTMHGPAIDVGGTPTRSVAGTRERPEPTGPYTTYRRALLSPDRVRELSTLRPWVAVRDTAWCWLGIVSAWAACAVWTQWWVVLLAVPVIGTRYYGLFIIGHDGMHSRLFRTVRANRVFCDLLIFGPIGLVTRQIGRNHLLHHQHLTTEQDPDLHKHACFNKSSRLEYVLFLTGLASVIDVALNIVTRRGSPAQRTGTEKKPGARRDKKRADKPGVSARDLAIVVGWQVALLGGLSWFVGWWAWAVLWVLPVYLFAYLPNLVRSFVEHSHPEADSEADAHRLITFLSNPLERVFFAPMNMNYHVVHHLWPSIPYYNLPRADREIRGHPLAGELIWRGSYLGYLLRYWLALPLEECRVDPRYGKYRRGAVGTGGGAVV